MEYRQGMFVTLWDHAACILYEHGKTTKENLSGAPTATTLYDDEIQGFK